MWFTLLLAWGSSSSWAFCGTFVGDAGATLTNRSSQIVAVRQGDRTSLTLVNDYDGDLNEFALIIPVPPGFGEGDVVVVDVAHVQAVEAYSSPRLVEYTCEDFGGWAPPEQSSSLRLGAPPFAAVSLATGCSEASFIEAGGQDPSASGVTIEEQFTEGEYELTVLSSESGGGLMRWLDEQGYALGEGAYALLSEYVDAGSSFLAAKVSLDSLGGETTLRPLRISYHSEAFSLPIRLGALNSPGEQDLSLMVITDYPGFGSGAGGLVGVANYPEAELWDECLLPGADEDFGARYEEVFAEAIDEEGGAAWVAEYGWPVDLTPEPQTPPQHCDPCTTPVPPTGPFSVDTLADLGFVGDSAHSYYVSRLHLRYRPELVDEDLTLYESGSAERSQIRYIVHDEPLQDMFEVCGEGFVETDRYCRFTPRPSPMTGVVWAACSSQPARRLPALLVLLGAAALLRRRRSA